MKKIKCQAHFTKKKEQKKMQEKILIVDEKDLATSLSVFLYKINIKSCSCSLHIRHQP